MLLAIAYMNFIDKENKFELQNNGRNKTKAHKQWIDTNSKF